MDAPVLLVQVELDDEGMARILAPRVGWWSMLPAPGTLIGPGSGVGALTQLNRRFRLLMPEGASGRISDGLPAHRVVAVEYGQPLFRVRPVGLGDPEEAGRESGGAGHSHGEGLAPGAKVIVSPTDGVFYRRPSPDASPFVEQGGRLRLGEPVGLVEVMKTFNQILYEGPGYPDEAEVLEIRADDGQEVSAGQALLIVR